MLFLFGLVATIFAGTVALVGTLVVTRRPVVVTGADVGRAVLLSCTPILAWTALSGLEHAERSFWGAVLSTALMTVLVLKTLAPKVTRAQGAPAPAPSELLDRIAELSGKLGLAPPRVHVSRTLAASLGVQARVMGLASPLLVVDDGILHRLEPEERDAILAHELAHVATQSTWQVLTVVSLSSCVPALLTALGLANEVVAFACAAPIVTAAWRIRGRPLEIRCDLVGARVVGHESMASALRKIHAAGSRPQRGALALLLHATSTHPSLDLRRMALHRDAPAATRQRIAVDAVACRRHRLAARLALLAWVAVVGTTLAAAWSAVGATALAAALQLALVAMTPTLVLLAASWGHVRYFMLRPATWAPGSLRAFVAASVGIVALLVIESNSLVSASAGGWSGASVVQLALLAAATCAVGMTVWGVVLSKRHAALRKSVAEALAEGRQDDALALLRSKARALRRDPILRFNAAFAEAMAGRSDAAFDQLRCLSRERRLPGLPEILMARLVLDGQPDRALELAREARERMRGEAAPVELEVRALRRLGRLEQAEALASAGLAAHPHDGALLGVASGVALDRGDLERARALADEALARSPGDARALMARAGVEAEMGTRAHALAAIADAERSLSAHAYVLSRWELDRARARLAERDDD